MSYTCRVYGLGLIASQPIPTVPPTTITSIDVRVHFGQLPECVKDDIHPTEPWYAGQHTDAAGNPLLRVFRLFSGKYFRFLYADQTEFVIDQSGQNVWAVWPSNLTIEDTTTYLLGPIMGFVLLLRGKLSLHASAVVIQDHAVAFLGPAGSGKSTLAAAFAERGHRVLAEDIATLEDRGNNFLVLPAYPCVRLWPPSVIALYGSESALAKLTPTWNKRYLDLTQQRFNFSEQPVLLGAIYLLGERKKDSGAPYVVGVSSGPALLSLIANTYTTRIMDKEMRGWGFKLLSRVHAAIPVREITPHSDPSRIPELCATIVRDFETQVLGMSDERSRAVS